MLATGIPVVTAKTIGVYEVLGENPLVKVVPFEDEKALANAIMQTKNQVSNEQSKHSLSPFSVTEKQVARQFLKVIDDVGV